MFSRYSALSLGLMFAVGGCASQMALSRLDPRSRDDWKVCVQNVAKSQCGQTVSEAASDSLPGFAICINPLIDSYVETPRARRQQWLIRHGCPRDIVDPDHGAAKKADDDGEQEEAKPNQYGFADDD